MVDEMEELEFVGVDHPHGTERCVQQLDAAAAFLLLRFSVLLRLRVLPRFDSKWVPLELQAIHVRLENPSVWDS